MKSASISELKGTLKSMSQLQLAELCLRLARYKKENKELLTFLLYEADDLAAYLNALKKEMETDVASINTGNWFWAKKSLRKIIRYINKHVRYTGSKVADVELRLFFCELLQQTYPAIFKNTAGTNLYYSQLKKAEIAFKSLHEDIQHDYKVQLDALKEG